MIYPNVALRIEDYLPSIELHTDADTVATMATAAFGIDQVLLTIAKNMGVDWDMEEIINRIHEADDALIEFPELDLETDSLDLAELEQVVMNALAEYSLPEGLTPEVTAELNANWYSDVLASYLRQIYTLLTVRTVFMAGEVGIGSIQLIDHGHDSRLREQMSRDLATIDIELLVPDDVQIGELD